ncbi:polysaccharide biosynthesis/export family protein [Parabacteroides bouchesdurhonensis]|uniref:polysaccharide biosynthesis/export family protein n=1 Tax=Parabacteroides bouchesdurhonensis TaxID=1936995 RepID=UPI000E537358|nr:polysaccharide biosynthesis/export family protein [Parabacteroides bouchesdurhonensis]RHJ94909.1 polysaccharide export protein [Bacteroides sp. AM07-16]
MKRVVFPFSGFALLLVFLASCGSVKDITYLQTDGLLSRTEITDTFELRIQTDDLLDITVNSIEEGLTAPFNLQPVVGNGSGYQRAQGFLVDREGYINYPVLGKIKVGGLKRRELVDMLQDKLSLEGYIKDPIVTVRFSNFRITVLGEVSRPGTYNIDTEQVTLFDALGLAGDLNLYGRRDRVAVIREDHGTRTILYHDLRSIDVMQSPFFYLKQNDVVYVEPNRVRGEQSTQNQFTNIGTWISMVNFLTTMGLLIFK